MRNLCHFALLDSKTQDSRVPQSDGPKYPFQTLPRLQTAPRAGVVVTYTGLCKTPGGGERCWGQEGERGSMLQASSSSWLGLQMLGANVCAPVSYSSSTDD